MFNPTATIIQKTPLKTRVAEDDMETEQVTVAPDTGIANISDVLNGLYKDTEYAVIREYLTNAKDAHEVAQTEAPIELFMGKNLDAPFIKYDGDIIKNSTYFVVKDHGTGMSLDEIKNIYAKYGASTKMNTPTLIGKFGVGSKVALHLSKYFEIHSIKDGYESVCVMDSNTENISILHIKTHQPTSKPNGTTIKIPVPPVFWVQAEQTIGLLTRSWAPGSVLLNNNPVPLTGELYDSEKYVTIHNASGNIIGWVSCAKSQDPNPPQTPGERIKALKNSNLIVGGVPYFFSTIAKQRISYSNQPSFHNEYLYTLSSKDYYTIILNLPAKAVTLTPSRENIKTTEENTKYIQQQEEQLASLIQTAFIEKYNSLPDRKTAIKFYRDNWFILNPKEETTPQKDFPFKTGKINLQWELSETYGEGAKTLTSLNPTPTTIRDITLSFINTEKYSMFSLHLTRGKKYYFRDNINVVVYGIPSVKSKTSEEKILKNNLTSALKQKNLDTKNSDIYYAWVMAPTAPPEWVTEDYDNIIVLHIDEIVKLAREYRKGLAATRKLAPEEEKTVKNSYYLHLSLTENNEPFVELLNKKDIKQLTKPVYYIHEADPRPVKYRFYGQYTNDSWEKTRLSYKTTEPVTDTATLHNLKAYIQLLNQVGSLILVPRERTLNSFLTLNPEKLVPLNEYTKHEWEKLTEDEKILISTMMVLVSHPLRSLTKIHMIFYGTDMAEEYANKVDNRIVKKAMFTLGDKEHYLTTLIPVLFQYKQIVEEVDDRVGKFNEYYHQLNNPSPEVLTAVANISELKN